MNQIPNGRNGSGRNGDRNNLLLNYSDQKKPTCGLIKLLQINSSMGGSCKKMTNWTADAIDSQKNGLYAYKHFKDVEQLHAPLT